MIADKILLLVCDALRLDHWDHGFREAFGPSADSWFTVSHCSDPNFASIYTGLHPTEHGVVLQMSKHRTLENTLAMEARFCGLKTATLKAKNCAEFYAQGFDMVLETTDRDATCDSIRPLIAFMQESSRYFVAVRLFESHAPYIGSSRSAPLPARYKTGVGYALEACKRLVAAASGAFVIITSDHGEALGEHGTYGHAHGLYDELLRVPFWCSDMYRLAGNVFQHTSVYNLLTRGYATAASWPLSFCGLGAENGSLHWYSAVRTKHVKTILSRDYVAQERVSVFDLDEDPGEQNDLAASMPVAPETPETDLSNPKIYRRLKRLGYL